MTSMTFDRSADVAVPAGAKLRPSLFQRFVKQHELAAKSHVTAFFATLSDSRLADLGFDAGDIAAIRRGEHRLPNGYHNAR